jgi:hypothetical protein
VPSCESTIDSAFSSNALERVDAACARALLLNARSYKSVAAILQNGKDKRPPRPRTLPSSSIPTSVAAVTTIDQEIVMLIHRAIERLRALGLTAMADALIELQNNPQAIEMPHADWLGLVIDHEVTFRDNRRLVRRLAAAKLRQAATIENIDYRTSRGLDRPLFQSLTTNQWVREYTWQSSARPVRANRGSPARSATRPAATAFQSSTNAHHACSPTSLKPAAKAAWRD